MNDMVKDDSKGGIQVIARAATILRVLRNAQGGMSLGQIAEAAQLPRSTVQRIVGALQEERMVISAMQGGGLRIGPEMQSFAEAARYNIVESCRLLLTELTQDTNETADLSVLRGAGMIFLDQVPGTHRLRTVSSVGEVFPLTTTANGKACLALLPSDRALALIQAEWARRGQSHDLESLLSELSDIRETGLAYDREDHTEGIAAIGIGFRDWTGDLHAISVPIPVTRFDERRSAVEQALRRTSIAVQRMMDR
ncbi:transcriptional regulator [Thioclava sp. SK-1]|uniref:IclR family transcriptional regulator n=1 Tax=Thioclava sp. SK-1 TaxID=1889770 RepID=UPI0008264FEC|nr:IclR family transcriptional regulator [Thioclava sp. SK-1]OCX66241.1 transcriptional regulator [Thioclava sp. SK-1]